jgi:hypothetical protein
MRWLTLFLAVSILTVAAQAETFDVNVNLPWQATGLTIEEGMTVTFNATGEWFAFHDPMDPLECNHFGPDGLCAKPDSCFTGDPAEECLADESFLVPGVSAYSAVARIGDCPGFFIGSEYEMVSPCTGELYLAMNHDFYIHSSGWLQVEVRVSEALPAREISWGWLKYLYR